jgi:hypothetical protein
MDKKHDVDPNGKAPQPEENPAADEMEQAQKEGAEQRSEGGGYGG